MNPTTSTRLPVELLLLVKGYIPTSDLRTHVCFYYTCRTTASFYGNSSQQAAFWRRACALSGIGWLKTDSSWKEIAIETIEKDGFCSHPHCGGTLLDWNAARIEQAMHRYSWDPEEGAWDATFDEEHAEEWTRSDRPIPVCNVIFQHICFSALSLPPWYAGTTDPRLHVDGQSLDLSRLWVTAHPIAVRSFATFPTVRRMRLLYKDITYGSEACAATGVTVWAVLRSIQADLDSELSVRQLIDLVTGPFASLFHGRYSNNFGADLERFSTLRGLWSSARWEGLHFLRSDDYGPIFFPTFAPRRPNELDVQHVE